MNCSLCQTALSTNETLPGVALCQKCDLYHIYSYALGYLNELLDFLGGKKFIFHSVSFSMAGTENLRLREFVDSILRSSEVKNIKFSSVSTEDLVSILDLLAKLPNCSVVSLEETIINEETATNLCKIMACPQIDSVSLRFAKFTQEACQTFAESMDPHRFDVLYLGQCDIPDASHIFKALIKTKITMTPMILTRPMSDKECAAFSNLIKINKHIEATVLSHLSSIHSKSLVEALKESNHLKQLSFMNCDLVGVMQIIAELLCTSKSITTCSFSYCTTEVLLKEFCDRLKERKSTVDLTLKFEEVDYRDSLQPIASLLESNANISGLVVMTTSGDNEWISVIESLKTNTTLKSLQITFSPENSQTIIDAIANVLKINNTLRSLKVVLNDEFQISVLDELITVVASQNNIESLILNGRVALKTLTMTALCHMLKKNWRLKNLCARALFESTKENVQLLKELMEENHVLLQFDVMKGRPQRFMSAYKVRNQQYQEEWTETKQDILVLIHNMARNAQTIRELLPIDVWVEVFKHLKYPLMPPNGFENVAKKIFRLYKLY